MGKPKFSIFTAQDARNITTVESGPNLGQVIDVIRAVAKRGGESINIAGAPIDSSILDTLEERGFTITETHISWALEPVLEDLDTSEVIDNEPAEVQEEEE